MASDLTLLGTQKSFLFEHKGGADEDTRANCKRYANPGQTSLEILQTRLDANLRSVFLGDAV